MKKLLIIFTFTIMTLISVGFTQTYAVDVDGDMTWSCEAWAEDDMLIGDAQIPSGVTSLTVGFPSNAQTQAGFLSDGEEENFDFLFYDGATLVKALWGAGIWRANENIVSSGEDVTYHIINFDAYDLPSNVDSINIQIPVIECDQYFESQAFFDSIEFTYTFDDLAYGRIGVAVYPNYQLAPSSTYYEERIITGFIPIPHNTTSIEMNGRLSWFNTSPASTGIMHYYDEDKNLINSIDVSNEVVDTGDPYHDWFPYEVDTPRLLSVAWSYYGYDVSNEIRYIRFETYDFNSSYILTNVDIWSNELFYYLDGEYLTVNYVVDGDIDETYNSYIGAITPYLDNDPTLTGHTFSHWIDPNGVEFDPENSSITITMVNNDIVNITAIFTENPSTIDLTVEDPTPDGGVFEDVLDDVGFNDAPERVIVFAVIIIVVSIALLALRLPFFNIIVVDAIITAFFMSLGLLPVFVSVIIGILFVFLAYKYVMGGGGSNE